MRVSIIAFIALLLLSPVYAGTPVKYITQDIIVEIQEDKSITEQISFTFPESVDKFNYYIAHPVTNLRAFANDEPDCEVQYEMSGTLISCKDFNSLEILLSFDYPGLITQYMDSQVFSDRYVIATPTDNFPLRIYLPKGYILSEPEQESVESNVF